MSNKHVFISHSHKDSATAISIVAALEKRGVPCWMAPRDVPPGGSYAEAILTAIETASCFVLIYSENSNVSSHVLREVERALKFGVNIVPVRFDDSTPSKSLDYLLATVHWLSIPAESRDSSIARAAEQIAEWLTNFMKNPAQPLPVRKGLASQPAMVTSLEPAHSRGGLWIAAAAIALALLGAGTYATGYLRLPNKTDAGKDSVPLKPKSFSAQAAATAAPSIFRSPGLTERLEKAKANRPIGYAIEKKPAPSPTAAAERTYNNTNNSARPQMPDPRGQNPGGMNQQPQGPGGPMQFGNGNGPGMNQPPDGQFGPPPPPPPPGGGGPGFGPPNGGGPGGPPRGGRP